MAIRKMSAGKMKNGNVGDQRIRRVEEMLANGGGQRIRAVEEMPETLESDVVYVLVEDDGESEDE